MATPAVTPESPTLQEAASQLTQARQNPTPSTTESPSEPQNQAYTFSDLGEGNVEIKFQTGETFKGSQADVLRKIAEANANTRVWAHQQKHQAEQYQQQLQQIQAQFQPQQPQAPQIDPAAAVMADMMAPFFGFKNGQEMRDTLQGMSQTTEDMRAKSVAQQFFAQNDDFVSTEQNGSALIDFVNKNGLNEANPYHLKMAHQEMVRQNLYPNGHGRVQQPEPRPTPNPTLNGSFPAPTGGVTEQAANEMPLEQLGSLLTKMRRNV